MARPLPLTKVRAAQIAGVTERAIRAALARGDIEGVEIAEGTDGASVIGVPANFLSHWKPDPTRVGRRGRGPGPSSPGP